MFKKLRLACDPTVTFLGIYLYELKVGCGRGICIIMLMGALLTIAKCESRLSIHSWMNR